MNRQESSTPRIGLALGGGGVRGFAHIPILEALDEVGLKPCIIAGTSIGALIGALYASGMSGREIRTWVRQGTVSKADRWRDLARKKDELWSWFRAIVPDFRGRGLLRSERIVRRLLKETGIDSFEALPVPLSITATDLRRRRAVVISSGPLAPALQASMAIPGVFAPVLLEGAELVDGGVMNLVPLEMVKGRCGFTVAVNVARPPARGGRKARPGLWDLVWQSIDLMQLAQLDHALRRMPPGLLVEPPVGDVPVLRFDLAEEVMTRAGPTARAVRRKLEGL